MSDLPITSVIAAVEVPAAIHARWHRREIDAGQRELLLEIASRILQSVGQIGLAERARSEAAMLAGQHLLRALDAIHVGTAVVASRHQRRRGLTVRFCTADRRQAGAASAVLGVEKVDLLPAF
jgi:hypothetical protein